MLLNLSAKFGSFRAVTSFIAPFIDFSSDKSFISSVARTSLSPEMSTKVTFSLLQFRLLCKMVREKDRQIGIMLQDRTLVQ